MAFELDAFVGEIRRHSQVDAVWRNLPFNRGCIRVLAYHGLIERRKDSRLERNFHLVEDFRRQIRFLKKFRVVSLAELHEVIQHPAKLKTPTVAFTFDDGYKNNLLAHEILGDAGFPWSVFVSTGAINSSLPIWTIELSLLILHGNAVRLNVLDNEWRLSTRSERESTFQDIRFRLKRMPRDQKDRTMDRIRAQFPDGEINRLLEEFPSMALMNWEQIRSLMNGGTEIGSHGVYHEIHHDDQPRSVRLQELADSRHDLERTLGRPCRFFAFPNGDSSGTSASEVREAGYDLAFLLHNKKKELAAVNLLPRLTPPSSLESFKNQFFAKSTF